MKKFWFTFSGVALALTIINSIYALLRVVPAEVSSDPYAATANNSQAVKGDIFDRAVAEPEKPVLLQPGEYEDATPNKQIELEDGEFEDATPGKPISPLPKHIVPIGGYEAGRAWVGFTDSQQDGGVLKFDWTRWKSRELGLQASACSRSRFTS